MSSLAHMENVSCGLSKKKMSLSAAMVFARAASFLDVTYSTNVRSWALVPGSLVERAGQALIIPGEFKAPEMAWEITAVSSVGLNCKVDSAVGVISCQCRSFCCLALKSSVRRHAIVKANKPKLLFKNWNVNNQGGNKSETLNIGWAIYPPTILKVERTPKNVKYKPQQVTYN